jgi:Na+(H+)/acetate symporter ActP
LLGILKAFLTSINLIGAILIAGYYGFNPPDFAAGTVALAFGLAASSIFPALMMGIFSKKMNKTTGSHNGNHPIRQACDFRISQHHNISINFNHLISLLIACILTQKVDRDIMVLANPEIAGLPNWVIAIVAAGGLAAALSTAAGLLLAIASSISHDLLKGVWRPNISEKDELMYSRISMIGAILIAGYYGFNPPPVFSQFLNHAGRSA